MLRRNAFREKDFRFGKKKRESFRCDEKETRGNALRGHTFFSEKKSMEKTHRGNTPERWERFRVLNIQAESTGKSCSSYHRTKREQLDGCRLPKAR